MRDEPAGDEGRVLVVDDEGIELYEKAMEEGRPFDVVIMDLTIPGELGGKKTVGRLRELDPAERSRSMAPGSIALIILKPASLFECVREGLVAGV